MTQSAAILGCEGPTLSPDEHAFFADAQPWGFILFARNVETPDQVRALTADLREAVGRDAPILIDQEGGRVQRMWGPHWRQWHPPLDAVAAASDPARMLHLRAQLIAQELRALGITVNCAPTADIARSDTHPFLRNRLYGDTAAEVIPRARATAEGLIAGGCAPVMKHMPGHGRSEVDSHHDLPRVTAPRATLEAEDFAVFKALADLPMGMTAHLVYECIDPDAPATLSPAMIAMIRDDIGFTGLLMTDDLSMNALPGDIGHRAAAAKAAGVDLILHCNGERPDMEHVLANCGPLTGPAQTRADAALRAIPAPQTLDIPALEADLSDLLGGEVYV